MTSRSPDVDRLAATPPDGSVPDPRDGPDTQPSPAPAVVGSPPLGAPVESGTSAGAPGLRLDVSRYQGEIDWPRVAAWRDHDGARIVEVVAKLTQGVTYRDPNGLRNILEARAVGLRVGAYHYLTGADPLAQAAHFIDAWWAIAEPPDFAVLDVERAWTGEDVPAASLAWLRAVEAGTGVRPEVYTGLDFAARFKAAPEMADYALWVAAYWESAPKCPPPWASFAWWQYTASARVDGIAGKVDLSLAG